MSFFDSEAGFCGVLVSVPSQSDCLKSHLEYPVSRRRDGLGDLWGSRHYCALPSCHGRPDLPHDTSHIDFYGGRQEYDALPTSPGVIESGLDLVLARRSPDEAQEQHEYYYEVREWALLHFDAL